MRTAVIFASLSSLSSAFGVSLLLKEQTLPPSGWALDSTPPHAKETLILRIGLAQSDWPGLEGRLLNTSDPLNVHYGAHLSRGAVLDHMRPTNNTLSLVTNWLSSHGLHRGMYNVSAASDWFTIRANVSTAQKLLNCKFHAYVYQGDYPNVERILRTTSYRLPSNLHSHIDTIQPTTFFPTPSSVRHALKTASRRSKRDDALPVVALPVKIHPSNYQNCTSNSSAVFPSGWCLKDTYHAGNYTPLPDPRNKIGITGYLGKHAQRSDLELFQSTYDPKGKKTNYTFAIDTHFNPVPQVNVPYGNDEANLDVQIVAGIARPIPLVFYSNDAQPPYNPDENTPLNTNEPYLDIVDYLLSMNDKDLPSVLTTSYGDDEQSVPQVYAERVCRGYAALGARGTSVIFSTGDQGVGPSASQYLDLCLTNDGTNRTLFNPNFPASCPYVTSVGETWGHPIEKATLGSGGGYSRLFKRPKYQDRAVEKYQSWWGNKYAKYYRKDGRGIPDITSLGDRIPYYTSGALNLCFGTSCAAPTVAGIVGLLNDAKLRALNTTNGTNPRNGLLGFLNPLLYSLAGPNGTSKAFTDVVSGTNPGCGTDGFNATIGWDPVSGLGDLNFEHIRRTIVG